MDDVDRAQVLEQAQRDTGIQAALTANPTQQNRVGDRVYCLGCDIEIPDVRLEANPQACRCIDCQAQHERIT